MVIGRYTGTGHAADQADRHGRRGGEGVRVRRGLPGEDRGAARDFVEHLWARRKVGYLLDQIRVNGEQKELVDEVMALAKRYGIATPVHELPGGARRPDAGCAADRRPPWRARRPVPLPVRRSADRRRCAAPAPGTAGSRGPRSSPRGWPRPTRKAGWEARPAAHLQEKAAAGRARQSARRREKDGIGTRPPFASCGSFRQQKSDVGRWPMRRSRDVTKTATRPGNSAWTCRSRRTTCATRSGSDPTANRQVPAATAGSRRRLDRRPVQGRDEDGRGEGPERRVLPHPGTAARR